MSERRRKYRYDRVLIESARILSPQFDDAVLYFTGAQIEMLRNVTGYLRNLQTYVDEYHPGYYITPDATDYDDILAIVADMEETLMGNPNTIWGYHDRWVERETHTKSGAGDHLLWIPGVPEGFVYVVNTIKSRNRDTITTHAHRLADGSYQYEIAVFTDQAVGDYAIADRLNYPLKEGDGIGIEFFGCQDGDRLDARVWGYQMVVPA